MIKLGIVGCGDVAVRHYVPGLAPYLDRAQVAACFDLQPERAERAAALFPGAIAYTTYADLLKHPGLDAVINLTPAPFHAETTAQALDAGLHVLSEKPLATTVEEAQGLISRAAERGRLLLCAPAVMATNRFRWLQRLIADGRIGPLTLATAHFANMGPATWRDYTGDPAVFYSAGVGPVFDTGVYVLTAITGLFGPAQRVQAFGGVAIPRRNVLIERLAGQTIEVGANDHMLIHLDFGQNRFAQILSSFAVPASKSPVMEIHGTGGTISIGDWFNANGPVDIYLRDDTPLGAEGWFNHVSPPGDFPRDGLIQTGPGHFVDCLTGATKPLLTAEHACHVLEIMLNADQSTRDGRALALETRF